MKKAVPILLAFVLILVLATVWRTRPLATPSRPIDAPKTQQAIAGIPSAEPQPEILPETAEPPHEVPPAIAPVSRRRPIDPKKLLDAIQVKATGNQSQDKPAPTGSLAGTLAGLREGESGGVFAIKGDFSFANVSEDDLYDFGAFADSEAHVAEDGTFSMNELEDGHYTIIAFSMRSVGTTDAEFYYTHGSVDIANGGQAKISLTLK